MTHSVTISDSTISGNHAVGFDGPYFDLAGSGGGVFVRLDDSDDTYGGVDTLTVTLANSTIAGNTGAEGGGGVYNDIFNDAVITLDHTIVADNTAGFGGDVRGSVNANWSLIEDHGHPSSAGPTTSPASTPQLSPLADNGGPTLTQMIAPTSPAHNGGNPAFGPRCRPSTSGAGPASAGPRSTSAPWSGRRRCRRW